MTVWISHRGYHHDAPENSQAAFQAAYQLGFRWLETDLRLSRDGHIVLCHDPTLARIAQRPDRVRDLSRKELEQIEVGDGHRLFFFDEFAEQFADCQWTLDLKPEDGTELLSRMAEWIDKNAPDEFWQRVRFLLWSNEHEAWFAARFPQAQFYARESECWRHGLTAIASRGLINIANPNKVYSLPPRVYGIPLYRRWMVESFRRRGVRVVAFLPEGQQVGDALRVGVDQILTNGRPVPDRG